MNEAIYDKFRKAVEVIKVDSASYEILSAAMMRGRAGSNADAAGDMSGCTQNMRLIARDAVHCARRAGCKIVHTPCQIGVCWYWFSLLLDYAPYFIITY